jgi:DNA-binding MarR family transcriptional regulator
LHRLIIAYSTHMPERSDGARAQSDPARPRVQPGPARPQAEGPARTDQVNEAVEAVLAASRVLVAVAARSLAVAGEKVGEEVTLPQYRALVILASRGPQRLVSLAEALGVTPPTATRMCDRLVAKGLVKRSNSRRDRREIQVALTTEGSHLVSEVSQARRKEIRALLRGLSSQDRADMIRVFNRLSLAAGEIPDQDWMAGWEL